jgi:hypothetical protein
MPTWRPVEGLSVTTQFITEMRAFLYDPITVMTYRCHPENFSRDRFFSFPRLAIAILKEHAFPAQTRLIHLFREGAFGNQIICPTASAFYQARSKLDPSFYKEWVSRAVQFFYSHFHTEHLVTTWHNRYLWAIDCSMLNLPDTPETRSAFSIQRNQVPGSEIIQGKASFSYDVLNELVTDVLFDKIQAEKQFLVEGHTHRLNPAVIAIYDRGYANYETMVSTVSSGANFVIRSPSSRSFKVINDFMNSDAIDQITIISVPRDKKRTAAVLGWPFEVHVRLVKVALDDDTIEVLITSLLDRDEYPTTEFKWLYGKRWGVETAFFRFKNQLEVECFSSGKVHNIKQDFNAMVFLLVFESIMNKAQDHNIKAKSQEMNLKHEYHINKAGAYSMLSIHLVGIFLSEEKDLLRHLIEFQQDLCLSKSVIRPDRHYQRLKLNQTERVRYIQYRRKRRC